MLYRWKVRLLKHPRLNLWWRYWRARQGESPGDYGRLPELIRQHSVGHTFVDVGCMWGVNGEFAFIAEEAGATAVKAVDVFGPTPEFEQQRAERRSRVEFILGDITRRETLEVVGETDVVFCAGVLYHHPSPFDLLIALRSICRQTLILRTSTIPEVRGLQNVAVYFPLLDAKARALWNLTPLGVLHQEGISNAFQPSAGYGNWFWGLTPSCLESLLQTAGFRVDLRQTEAFAQTVVCTATSPALAHPLLDQRSARRLAAEISAAGTARPA